MKVEFFDRSLQKRRAWALRSVVGVIEIIARLNHYLNIAARWLISSHGQAMSLLVLLVTQASLLACSANTNSPTRLEPALLAAGVSHWELGRFDLYCVNPPLVRMVAALPVVIAGCQTNWSCYDESPARRPEFGVGRDFVRANGLRSRQLFAMSRLACIPFALLGGLTCFYWSRSLWGPKAGIFALALWTAEPNILGHGALITNDVPAASAGLVASFVFSKWLAARTWELAVLTGAALAFAILTKMTWLILFALWPIFVLPTMLRSSSYASTSCGRRSFVIQSLMIPFLAVFTINVAYGFSGSGAPLASFAFRSHRLAATQSLFGHIGLSWVPVLVPRAFALGLDTQAVDFETFPADAYLHGLWIPEGTVWYYLYAALFKVPLGLQLLALLAAGVWIRQAWIGRRFGQPVRKMDFLVLTVTPLAVGMVLSSQTEVNEHFRYAIPCLSFLLVGASSLAACSSRLLRCTALLALGLVVQSSLLNYPHCLAYFNEFAGGATNGHHYLLGSNLDWEQDLYRLSDYRHSHGDQNVWLAYDGAIDPNDLGLNCKYLRAADFRSWLSSGQGIPFENGDLLVVRMNILVESGCEDLSIRLPHQTLTPITLCGRTLLVYLPAATESPPRLQFIRAALGRSVGGA